MNPKVILLHGLWMNGLELYLLARRLRRCGFEPLHFRYPSVRRSPAENARQLQQWLQGVEGDEIHFVAHSLGGIVLLHLFDGFPQQRPGRLVLLGTPARGSAVAERLSALPLLGRLLGRSTREGLLGGAPAWAARADLGVVGGTLGWGFGQLLGGLQSPHDGTVSVAETRLPGARSQLALPASHFGLLLSRRAARQVCCFLRLGEFENEIR